MNLPDTEGQFISFEAFIEQLQLPDGTPGATKRDQVVNYLATQDDKVMAALLQKVTFSMENGKLRLAVSNRRKELQAGEKTKDSGTPEILAGAGLGVLTVAEIFETQRKLIFEGTEREFHCPLDMRGVIDALEAKFAHEIDSGKLSLESNSSRVAIKNQAGELLVTVILNSEQRDSVAYPDHPLEVTVLKMSRANLELLEEQLTAGIESVLDEAITHAKDDRITINEGIQIGLAAFNAFAPAAKTGGIGSQVLEVIAKELDNAEAAYKVTRENEIGKAIATAEADKAQRQCMFCGVERITGQVSCARCGGAYEPAKKN